MNKKVVVPAVALIAVLAAGGLLYFAHIHALGKADAAPAPPTVPIVAATVAQHDVPIYLTGVGTVIAYNTDVVRAQIQGQIISINFTEGQTVHAGDLLAQIDPRPYQALIDQYTANLERDQAQLINAQANLTRYTTLGQKGWATSAIARNPEGASRATGGGRQGRSGTDRFGEGRTQLHATDVSDRWRGRDSTDRRRQHHQPVYRERPRRRHAARSDFADLHASGNGPAANPAATAKDQDGARGLCLQSG